MIYFVSTEKEARGCIAYFEKKDRFMLDTETTGKDPHSDIILSLQIGDIDNQWFVDCRKVNILLFKELLENKLCVMQNSKFDYKMLKKVGIILENIWDTMLAECVLYSGYKKWGYGLDKLTERYVGVTMSKDERMTFTHMRDGREFTQRQIEYGCKDVMYLEQIMDAQLKLLRKKELEDTLNLENQAVKALGDIEYNGMGFDKEKWINNTTQTISLVENLEKELDSIVLTDPKLSKIYKPLYIQGNLFGEQARELSINYASPSQILQICKDLGYNNTSTEERELIKLSSKHKFFEKLLELRENNKIVSTYGLSFLDYINKNTGRVHTSFWQVKIMTP